MKMFFEEYGMVVVVMVLAVSIITFSQGFTEKFGEAIETQWEQMIEIDPNGGGGE